MTKRSKYYNLGQHWKDKCPCHIKQQAVEEYFQGQKDQDDDGGNEKAYPFQRKLQDKSSKAPQETIPFERYAFQKGITAKYTINIPYMGSQLVLKIKGKVPKEFRGRNDTSSVRKEIKITWTRLGEYYANVTFEVQQTCKFYGEKGNMISLDPESKPFSTYHSPDGTWGEIGSFKNQEALLGAVLIGDVNFLNFLFLFQDFHEKTSALLSSAGLFVFFFLIFEVEP